MRPPPARSPARAAELRAEGGDEAVDAWLAEPGAARGARPDLSDCAAATVEMLTWIEGKRTRGDEKTPRSRAAGGEGEDGQPAKKKRAPAKPRVLAMPPAPAPAGPTPLLQWDKAEVAAWVKAEGFETHCGDTFAPLTGESLALLTDEDIVELSMSTKPIPAIVRREILASISRLT